MKDLDKFWESMNPTDRHVAGHVEPVKVERWLRRLKEHALSKVDVSHNDVCVDWGCGGGHHSKEIAKVCRCVGVDISQDSLVQAKKYCPEMVSTICVPPDPKEKLQKWIYADWLHCYAVIWHFPGLQYWKNITKNWVKDIKPTWITFQAKIVKKTEEKTGKDYEKGYMNALLLSYDDAVAPFLKHYDLVHYGVEKNDPNAHIEFGHFVFRRKD